MGLNAAALWYDGFAPNLPRLLIEALRWACSKGAVALNHVAASSLETSCGRITGIRAQDRRSGAEITFHGSLVVNTAGPWSQEFLSACGLSVSPFFFPVLAWNLIFDRPQISDHALAVSDKTGGGQTYFLVPWKGALAVGTGYAPWQAGPLELRPSAAQLRDFLVKVNHTLPGLELQSTEIARVHAGLLPAKGPGSNVPADRPIMVDHSECGGPWGLFTVSDVKFTTARSLAARFLERLFPSQKYPAVPGFHRPVKDLPPDYPYFEMPRDDDAWKEPLRQAIEEEGPETLADLLLRRSTLGDNPKRALSIAGGAARLFSWSGERQASEIERLENTLHLPGLAGRPCAVR